MKKFIKNNSLFFILWFCNVNFFVLFLDWFVKINSFLVIINRALIRLRFLALYILIDHTDDSDVAVL